MATVTSPVKQGAEHFAATLDAIPKVRPRYPLDTWTTLDAAKFWVRDYDPETPNALRPALILGVVARVLWPLLSYYPLTRKMAKAFLEVDAPPMASLVGSGPRIRWSSVIHKLAAECFEEVGANLAGPANKIETPNQFCSYGYCLVASGYCHTKTCRSQESWMRGCIKEHTFNRLVNHNLVVPWEQVNWAGLGCLVPLLRESTQAPYIAVRKTRSHLNKPYIPLVVAEMLRRMNSVLPPILKDYAHTTTFQQTVREHLDSLQGERLRYWGIVASSHQCKDFMDLWDYNFAACCWSFGKKDEVYAELPNPSYWGVTAEVYEKLSESQSGSLFPNPHYTP